MVPLGGCGLELKVGRLSLVNRPRGVISLDQADLKKPPKRQGVKGRWRGR